MVLRTCILQLTNVLDGVAGLACSPWQVSSSSVGFVGTILRNSPCTTCVLHVPHVYCMYRMYSMYSKPTRWTCKANGRCQQPLSTQPYLYLSLKAAGSSDRAPATAPSPCSSSSASDDDEARNAAKGGDNDILRHPLLLQHALAPLVLSIPGQAGIRSGLYRPRLQAHRPSRLRGCSALPSSLTCREVLKDWGGA
ncbi:hypothetical protein HaLaN_23195 [Haematococcus lacustris]|uniref:Uncharacterized protein n=1 Tax=Haematococcus lacustris TaxID=44745 RepID=A0A699ZZI3_HAELA|nr:hypothetical protein HaLaN_23195 [Haematococcus lacustris]